MPGRVIPAAEAPGTCFKSSLQLTQGRAPGVSPLQKPLLPGDEGISLPSPPPPPLTSSPLLRPPGVIASGMFKFNLTQNQKDFSRIQKPHVEPKLPAGNTLLYDRPSRKGRTVTPPPPAAPLLFMAEFNGHGTASAIAGLEM